MSKFVVFNQLEWKVPLKAELLSPPKIKLDVSFPDTDLKQMVGKQRAAFDKAWKAFEAKFHKLGSTKIKMIQDAIDWTEERIKKKATKKEREEVVNTANKLLEKGFKTFESEIGTLAQKCYEDALAQSCKAMKMKLLKAKAKAIVKITIISLLILTAAGLAIGAAVVTGGATLPVIAGAVVTGLGAAYGVYKVVDKEWASSKNQLKLIKKDVDELNKVTGKLEELKALATTGAPDLLAKLEKVKAVVGGKMSNLGKHVGQLDKYIFKVSKDLEKQNDELNKLTDKINKTGDKKLKQKANKLSADIMKSLGSLHKMGLMKEEAQKATQAWERQQTLDLTGLGRALQAIAGAAPFLKDVANGMKDVVKHAGGLAKAVA